jgi:hypothetical protein
VEASETWTPACWKHDDKFYPLEKLASISYFPVPGAGKIKFTGTTPDYQNIDSLPIYFESDTCGSGSTREPPQPDIPEALPY